MRDDVCSNRNESVVSTQLSEIRVYLSPPGLDVPIVCVQRVKAPGIETSPLQLLSRETDCGAIVIQEGFCNGCGCASARINL